eukprot:TRINITY_DN2869_c0_g2_i1.p1 TRINITY_DN2869_c0_g2~~TRINITY_DN2869_c0_g2_i1.p1  ORF type:complete len:267 (-),score=42.69 TRINITY_DN2869_c0_g2_i1:22-822(-)
MERIRDLVEDYPYVAMDTEFPGVVIRPTVFCSDYQYQFVRCNVNVLKIIQLGLTFSDENGNRPEGTCTWQFNFRFNLQKDSYAHESIDLLTRSGIDFDKNFELGIEVNDFGELLMSSGIVLNENIRWISFHSGYDFGYLLKLLTCSDLPETQEDFFELVQTYFPKIYDIKYLMKSCKNLKGGLQELAGDLDIVRIGPQHQAGSDSLLTLQTFFRLKSLYFEDTIDDDKFVGVLYGLGGSIAPDYHPIRSRGSIFVEDVKNRFLNIE